MSLIRGLAPTSREPSSPSPFRKGRRVFRGGSAAPPQPLARCALPGADARCETRVNTQGAARPAAGALGGWRVRSRGADAKRLLGFPIRHRELSISENRQLNTRRILPNPASNIPPPSLTIPLICDLLDS